MKNLLIAFTLILFFSFLPQQIQAQTCFDKGTFTLSPGIGIGYYGYYGSYTSLSVPIIVSAEYHFTDMVSGGIFLSRSNYKHSNYSWTYTGFGIRGSFHWNLLLEKWTGGDWKTDKFDLYTAAVAGYEIANVSRFDGYTGNVGTSSNRLIPGIVAGARWYFIDNVAVFAEVGNGFVSYLTGGITIRI